MVGIVSNKETYEAEFRPNSDHEGEYKEVVVIGNGPSGIVLSYFLAGNWPYYNGLGEDLNTMLHLRLMAAARKVRNKSNPTAIVEQDLAFLSQDLEGRSANPVSLLFDILNHPQADLGLELPSLLDWKLSESGAVNHVVIGRGPPGGAWQSMDGSVLTISLGCWMELPQLNFREWEAQQPSRSNRGESRAPVSSVAQYYCDYVKVNDLDRHFLENSVVIRVSRVKKRFWPKDSGHGSLLASPRRLEPRHRRHTIGEIPLDSDSLSWTHPQPLDPLWEVSGYTGKILEGNEIYVPFKYLTRNVVLASGASDDPNILNVPGENLPFVLHSLNHLEDLIVSGHLNKDSDPILVVGAGLSAADAIIAARFHSVPVIHIFRRSVNDPNLIFRQLPQNMYPEYHKVYQMMKDPSGYDGYRCFEEHVLLEVRSDHKIKVAGQNCCGVAKVSYIVVCIGSHPNLSFMGSLATNMGVYPGLPIDCKRNPVAIEVTSHESTRLPGLYAMGPLIGENFVRFLQGGALAIASDINKKKKLKSDGIIGVPFEVGRD